MAIPLRALIFLVSLFAMLLPIPFYMPEYALYFMPVHFIRFSVRHVCTLISVQFGQMSLLQYTPHLLCDSGNYTRYFPNKNKTKQRKNLGFKL